MPDKILDQAALSLRNMTLNSANASVVSATSEANLFRKENLLDERRSKRYRTTGTAVTQVIAGTFGESSGVSMMALVDSNVSTQASRLSDATASSQLWLKADTTSGSSVYALTDYSGQGRDATIDGGFGFFTIPQWHKADAITPQGDDTRLDSWPDSSTTSSGPAATGTGNTRPKYRTGSGAAGHNNLPTVQFVRGDSTILDLGSAINLGTSHMIAMRVMLLTVGTDNYLCGDTTSNYVNVKASTLVYAAGGSTVTFSWTASTLTWYTIAIVRNGTSVSLVVNGTLISTQTLGANNNFSLRYLGNATAGSSGLGGYMAEWLYTNTNSALAAHQAGAYLCRKYACTTFAPVPTVSADATTGFNRVLLEDTNTGWVTTKDTLAISTGTTSGVSLGTSHTIVMSFVLTSTSGTSDLLGDTSDTFGTTSYLRYSGSTLTYRPATSSGSTTGASVSVALSTNTRYTLAVTRDGGSVTFRLNGALIDTVTLDTSLQQVPFTLKGIMSSGLLGENLARGYLHELFVSSSALGTAATRSVEDHLASKWQGESHSYGSIVFETCPDGTFANSNTHRWTLQSYTQSQRRTLRWYLAAPDNVSHAAAQTWTNATSQSYWRIKLPVGASGDSYFEVGVVWVGTYTTLPIDFGMSISVRDPSLVSESDAGATFIDARRRYHEITTTSTAMEEVVTKTLLQEMEDAGVGKHCLFDIWASSDDNTMRANGCYYGRLGGMDEVASFARTIAQRDDVSLIFVEARA